MSSKRKAESDSSSSAAAAAAPSVVGGGSVSEEQQRGKRLKIALVAVATTTAELDVKMDSSERPSSHPAPPTPASSVLEWKGSEVAKWIRSLNPMFDPYVAAFERDGVDGQMLVYDLDDEWLTSRMPNSAHRNQIRRAINSLKERFMSGTAGAVAVSDEKTDATNARSRMAMGSHMYAVGSVIGDNGRVVNASVYNDNRVMERADIKPEPYDFSSIIERKLSDINLESFGREWLYERMYHLLNPPPQTLRTAQTVTSQVLLAIGEPVRPDDMIDGVIQNADCA